MVGVAGASVAAILTRAPSAGGKSRLFSALGRSADLLEKTEQANTHSLTARTGS